MSAAAEGHADFVAKSEATVVVLGNSEDPLYVEGCSNAAENMLVAARALGLGACWAQLGARPFGEEVRKLVGAPETLKAECMIGIGHPMGHPEKPKRPLAEVLHWEKF
jgi:nitroreductase